jgi:hypothetical protein
MNNVIQPDSPSKSNITVWHIFLASNFFVHAIWLNPCTLKLKLSLCVRKENPKADVHISIFVNGIPAFLN